MSEREHEAIPAAVAAVLAAPVAQALLVSTVPARLAYQGRDGTPRALPIWFHWNGEAFVLASRDGAAKVAAIRRRPAVAMTIDSEQPPYRMLQVRGEAVVDVVPGIAPEYALAAHRYYGEALGDRWLERMRGFTTHMARIVVRPIWARVFDVGEVFPESRIAR